MYRSPKMNNHLCFNAHLQEYINPQLTDSVGGIAMYMSRLSEKVSLERGYNIMCVRSGTLSNDPYFYTDTHNSNILARAMGKDDILTLCDDHFYTFPFDYLLVNNFFINNVKIKGTNFTLFDVSKIENINFQGTIQDLNPLNY